MPTLADITRQNQLRDHAVQRAHALREQAIQGAWDRILGRLHAPDAGRARLPASARLGAVARSGCLA